MMYSLFVCFFVSLVCGLIENTDDLGAVWNLGFYLPLGRSSHVLVRETNDTALLAFGRGASNSQVFQDLWQYNSTTKLWREIHPDGDVPAGRYYACGVMVDGTMYVYGGKNADQKVLNELWAFRSNTSSWVMVKRSLAGVWPPGSYRCSLAPSSRGFTLLFGMNVRTPYEFVVSMELWEMIQLAADRPKPVPRVSGCCSHDAFSTSLRSYCFGGFVDGYNGYDLNDTWVFDGHKKELTQIITANSDQAPQNRSFHMCVTTSRGFYVQGGWVVDYSFDVRDFWKYEFESGEWKDLFYKIQRGVPFFDSGAFVRLSPSFTFSWGGWSMRQNSNLEIGFNESDETLTLIYKDQEFPQGRFGSCMFTFGDRIFLVFGAYRRVINSYTFPEDKAWQLVPSYTRVPFFDAIQHRVGASVLVRGQQVLFFFGLAERSYLDEILQWLPNENGSPVSVVSVTTPVSMRPRPRAFTAMIFSSTYSQSKAIMFGGEVGLSEQLGDLWEFDLEFNLWTPLTVGRHSPQPRKRSCFINTHYSGLMLINGGDNNNLDDRWSLKFVNQTTVLWDHVEALPEEPQMSNYLQREGSVCVYAFNSPLVYLIGGSYEGSQYEILFNISGSINRKFPPTPGVKGVGQSAGTPYLDRWYFFGGFDETYTSLSYFYRLTYQSTCMLGSFRNASDLCDFCPRGTYGDNAGNCKVCPVGTFNGFVGFVGNTSCLPCPPGTYNNLSGSQMCLPCPEGYECPIACSQPLLLIRDGASKPTSQQPEDLTSRGITKSTSSTVLGVAIAVGCMFGTIVIFVDLMNRYKYYLLFREENDTVSAVRTVFNRVSHTREWITFDEMMIILVSITTSESDLPSESALREMFSTCSENGDVINFIHFRSILSLLCKPSSKKRLGIQIDSEKLGVPEETPCELELSVSTPWSWIRFDTFTVVHDGLGEIVRVRNSSVGGILSVLSYLGMAVVALYMSADYVENNVVENRASVPGILLLTESHNTEWVSFEFTFDGVAKEDPSVCDCSGFNFTKSPQLQYNSIEQSCVLAEATEVRTCVVRLYLTGVRIGLGSNFSLEITNKPFYATSITFQSSANTGGKSQSDTTSSTITITPAIQGTVFRGRSVPTTFTMFVFPTMFDTYDVQTYGYLMSTGTAIPGSAVPATQVSTVSGHIITVAIDLQVHAAISFTRRSRQQVIDFLSNLSAALPAVAWLCATLLSMFYFLRGRVSPRPLPPQRLRTGYVDDSAARCDRLVLKCSQGIPFREAFAMEEMRRGDGEKRGRSGLQKKNKKKKKQLPDDESECNISPQKYNVENDEIVF